MIIIPDVHGRIFWKDAIKDRENEEIVFLGDYNDAYPNEGITPDQALENFKEILEFKKAHNENVVLLIGNHDCHYFAPGFDDASRRCGRLAKKLCEIYLNSLKLFQLAYEKEINGKKYVFSHAGIHKLWLDDMYGKDKWDENTIVKQLNEDFQKLEYGFCHGLDSVSYYRGGFESYGSIVWADCREYDYFKKPDVGERQIYGHTQLESQPIVTDFRVCLDVRRGFILDNEGVIREIDGTEVEIRK